MSLVFATKAKLTAIANAIRTRAGSSSSMTLDDMADAIPALPNTYAAGDEGKVVDNGALVSQTSDTVTENDTYDTTLINSLTVNVSGGGGSKKATGTYTPTETYNTNGSRQITTIANIGFTPSVFILYASDRTDVISTSGAIIYADFRSDKAGNPLLTTIRFGNTSGGIATNNNTNNWTTQTNGYLYLNNDTVYFRSASNAQLIGNVEYTWEAYA